MGHVHGSVTPISIKYNRRNLNSQCHWLYVSTNGKKSIDPVKLGFSTSNFRVICCVAPISKGRLREAIDMILHLDRYVGLILFVGANITCGLVGTLSKRDSVRYIYLARICKFLKAIRVDLPESHNIHKAHQYHLHKPVYKTPLYE